MKSNQEVLRLTSLSGSAGCAAKLGQRVLMDLIAGLPGFHDPNLLIGTATGDDAGVYRLDAERALVQTLDFFTPIVDDPFDYGQIAAANALSDVYAMGGRPITAMNIVGMPTGVLPAQVISSILRGGAEKVLEARCCLVGGHSIKSPEPIFGLSVTGLVHPEKVIANTRARPGDLLILTKPLGTGIATTAIKRGLASDSLAKAAVGSMVRLNTPGAALAESGLVMAGTDVTGFGFLGHLANICRGSGVSAEVEARAVPILGDEVLELIDRDCIPGGTRTNLATAAEHTVWGDIPDRYKMLLADAQTSGPLLLCVARERLESVLSLLSREGTLCRAVVGRVTERSASLTCVR